MKRHISITLKIILGLIIIWGGFKLQFYLWPKVPDSNLENTEPTDTE